MGSMYLKCRRMTTRLDKTLKRELTLEGRTFILALSPEGLKLTLKGKRNGQELRWSDLISGDAALAAALNASLGTFAAEAATARPAEPKRASPKRAGPKRRGPKRAGPKRARRARTR
jgi:predicted component of type VI protein secretion system